MKINSPPKLYALAFGLFLGLCIWKFGNPVILDHKISPPHTPAEFLNEAWPTHWANWYLALFAFVGALLVWQKNITWEPTKWLWLLPLIWLGWQFVSATHTVDVELTKLTLWQLFGCVTCYFIGALIFARENVWRWLLPGLLAAFVFCLVRGVEQRLYEFPQNHQAMIEGERCGWTNFSLEMVGQMKINGLIIATNSTDVASPAFLAKLANGRVFGTLVYPNALAGIILLLLPLALTLAWRTSESLKRPIWLAVVGLTIFLGTSTFIWSGSKLGWLIGLGLGGLFLFRLDWPKKLKLMAILALMVFGLGIFAVRFHHYFAAGATSAGARLDYWQAGIQTFQANPVFGSGPGTFQRPYAQIKSGDSEMARLAHNDYLEQFSDSGVLGGLSYVTWICLALATTARKVWRQSESMAVATFIGLLGWFVQGFGEFSLYIPALAWTAFTLLGCLIGQKINQFDK